MIAIYRRLSAFSSLQESSIIFHRSLQSLERQPFRLTFRFVRSQDLRPRYPLPKSLPSGEGLGVRRRRSPAASVGLSASE